MCGSTATRGKLWALMRGAAHLLRKLVLPLVTHGLLLLLTLLLRPPEFLAPLGLPPFFAMQMADEQRVRPVAHPTGAA